MSVTVAGICIGIGGVAFAPASLNILATSC
jgi:hypothetical protein